MDPKDTIAGNNNPYSPGPYYMWQPENLPMLPLGYGWMPVKQLCKCPDGLVIPTVVGFAPVLLPNFGQRQATPIVPTMTPVPQIKAVVAPVLNNNEQQKGQALAAMRPTQVDEGTFGHAKHPSFDPYQYHSSPIASKVNNENPFASHEEVLRFYRQEHLSPEKAYPWSNYTKEYYKEPGSFKSSDMQNSAIRKSWLTAAIHFLPLDIIKDLDELECLTSRTEYEDFCFNIPCRAKITKQGVEGDQSFENSTIRLILSRRGRPLHLMLTKINNKKDSYIDRHLGDVKQEHEVKQKELHWPELYEAGKNSDVYKTYTSDYGLEITIRKKKQDR